MGITSFLSARFVYLWLSARIFCGAGRRDIYDIQRKSSGWRRVQYGTSLIRPARAGSNPAPPG